LRGSTKVCLALGALFAAASLAWMVFLPGIVERELRSATGFDIRVTVLKVDPFTGRVVVMGLKAQNPASFPTPEFIDLRELRADVNIFSWLFSERVVINELDVDTERIALIRQHDGKSNAGEFMAAFTAADAGSRAVSKPKQYLVRKLRIRLEELQVADYTGMSTDKKVYKVNIDHTYTNVTNPRELLVPEVVKTLYSFGLHHDIAKLLPGDIGQALATAVGGAAHVGAAIKGTLEKTGGALKGTLDKLEQSTKP
jgi:uncharacterized protein involved in outer membrane biogenesis